MNSSLTERLSKLAMITLVLWIVLDPAEGILVTAFVIVVATVWLAVSRRGSTDATSA